MPSLSPLCRSTARSCLLCRQGATASTHMREEGIDPLYLHDSYVVGNTMMP